MTREKLEKIINAILKLRESATDETALDNKDIYPQWKTDTAYTNERVLFNDNLYKCIQPHTSQATWTPDTAVSLWVRVDDPSVEWPEWVQPTGSVDAYSLGAKVSHLEKHWVSEYDNNVWEPSVFGWREEN